jgi:hypothetical protein
MSKEQERAEHESEPDKNFDYAKLSIPSKPVLLSRIYFGKHKGLLFRDIPVDYLRWLSKQDDLNKNDAQSRSFRGGSSEFVFSLSTLKIF